MPTRPVPEVIGVDDFALRKRHRYATVIINAVTRERLDAAIAACGEMTMLSRLVRGFAALLDPKDGNDRLLAAWIELARQVDLPHVHAFTRGLANDRAAVNAALSLPFHNGGTEGVNTKTKLLKRQIYGRTGFALRHRILLG